MEPVSFSSEPLIFMQPDMDAGNFGVDQGGDGPVGLRRDGAVARIVCKAHHVFERRLHRRRRQVLRLVGSPNIASMTAISIVCGSHPAQNSVCRLVLNMGF